MPWNVLLRSVLLAPILASCACGWESATATFNDPSGNLNIAITRQRAHLFLPRYAHYISIDGRSESGLSSWVESTTGTGATSTFRANLYRLDDHRLVYCAPYDNFTVTRESSKRDDSCRQGGRFIGSFDEDSTGRWRFIPSSERGELVVEIKE